MIQLPDTTCESRQLESKMQVQGLWGLSKALAFCRTSTLIWATLTGDEQSNSEESWFWSMWNHKTHKVPISKHVQWMLQACRFAEPALYFLSNSPGKWLSSDMVTIQFQNPVYFHLEDLYIYNIYLDRRQLRWWWHRPLIPALGTQRQADLWVRNQAGLHNKFQWDCLKKIKVFYVLCLRS